MNLLLSLQIEGREIHSEALNSFAELTSYTMELCHKSGELLLLSPEQERQVDVDAVSDAMIRYGLLLFGSYIFLSLQRELMASF